MKGLCYNYTGKKKQYGWNHFNNNLFIFFELMNDTNIDSHL